MKLMPASSTAFRTLAASSSLDSRARSVHREALSLRKRARAHFHAGLTEHGTRNVWHLDVLSALL